MIKKHLFILAFFFLVSCSYHYSKTYTVTPVNDLSPPQRLTMITSFKNHLIAEGYELLQRDNVENNTFHIRTRKVPFGLIPGEYDQEIIEISLLENDSILLVLTRITHHSEAFSKNYLQRFIKVTKKYFKDSSSQEVELILKNESE